MAQTGENAMGVLPTITLDATITERGQTTIPSAIRKMLGIQKGAIVFKGMPDGTVVIEPKRQDGSEDPVLAHFLAFLTADMSRNPQNLEALTPALLEEGRLLVDGVEIDLDAHLGDD
jgi:antitoxin PrlF